MIEWGLSNPSIAQYMLKRKERLEGGKKKAGKAKRLKDPLVRLERAKRIVGKKR